MTKPIEDYLLEEIAKLETCVASAQRELDILKRRLIQLRRSGLARENSDNRASVDRMVAEEVILDRLKHLGGSGKTARIYSEIEDALPMLTYGTFRTYLHRMKQSGLVHQRERGRWRLGPGKQA